MPKYSPAFDKVVTNMIYHRLDGDTCVETAENYVHDNDISEDPELVASLEALNNAACEMVTHLQKHFNRLNLENKYDMKSSEL